MAWVRKAAVAAAAVALSGACASEPGDENDADGLPALGQATYSVSFIGSDNDTTWNYTATAITYRFACIVLFNGAGGLTFGRPEGELPAVGYYPLRSSVGAPSRPGTIEVFTIHNGYSSHITGTIRILRSTPTQIGATFDFSAPTEQRPVNFTVRIAGSFLAVPNDDPMETC